MKLQLKTKLTLASKYFLKNGCKSHHLIDLTAILILCYAVRLTVAYFFYNSLSLDEIFQTYEPAYYLAFGQGILPWEFVLGIRSWLLPGILGGLIKIVADPTALPQTILLWEQGFLILLSLIPVVTAYFWGLRLAVLTTLPPRWLALALAVMVGVLSENIFLSSHASTEVVAAWLMFPAVYFAAPERLAWGLALGWRAPAAVTRAQTRALMACGLFIGLTLVMRFHLAPSLAVIAIVAAQGLVVWRWRWLMVGAGLPILGAGLLDWLSLGTPWQSIWLNLWVNQIDQVSRSFGVEPFWEILLYPLGNWGWFAPFALYFAWRGGRRVPLAALTIAAVVLSHGLIAHKEPRFIIPILPLLSFIVALGMIDFRMAAPSWLRLPRLETARGLAVVLVLWLGLSLSLTVWSGLRNSWYRGSVMAEMFRTISAMVPRPCGLALLNISFLTTPAQSGLSPTIELYEYFETSKLLRDHAPFDVVLSSGYQPELIAAGDRQYRCFHDSTAHDHLLNDFKISPPICIWTRASTLGAPGHCDQTKAKEIEMGLMPLPKARWQFGQKRFMKGRSDL
ncbi:MAG: hypothetical protein ORO03_10045 [Alphaproteobacteria bacterium]|nr:hypothetical protein [Alphaproteobacteria bacterium]